MSTITLINRNTSERSEYVGKSTYASPWIPMDMSGALKANDTSTKQGKPEVMSFLDSVMTGPVTIKIHQSSS
jgi:hypothetical protein